MNNCCDSSYYRTPYNIRYQNLYCSLAQEADTNLQTVITSGWSYKKNLQRNTQQVKENYCNCKSRLVNTPMELAYKENSRNC